MESPPTKPATQRRGRRSREEWRELVTLFEKSGQTKEAFCAERGLGVTTLNRWCNRFHPGTSASASPAPMFVELPAEEKSPPPTSTPWEIELQLSDGVFLRWRRVPC